MLSAFGVHLALASCIAFQLRVLGWDGDAVAILTRTCDNLRRTLSQRLQIPGLETAQARGAIQREMRSRSHRDICGHDPKRRPPTQDERQERTLRVQSVRSSEAARAKRFIAHRSAQESGSSRVRALKRNRSSSPSASSSPSSHHHVHNYDYDYDYYYCCCSAPGSLGSRSYSVKMKPRVLKSKLYSRSRSCSRSRSRSKSKVEVEVLNRSRSRRSKSKS